MTTFLDRLLGRGSKPKAVYGGPALAAYDAGIPLSAVGLDWQGRAAKYLDAYRVGWFYKAGSRIGQDFANLAWTLSYEDDEGDNAEEIVAPASNVPWEALDPLQQFLRLAERPNPHQTGLQLKWQQMVRLDFTGRAAYYLENGDGTGLPTAIYPIHPARLWKAKNEQGRLVGWILDKNAPSGGTPLSLDEVLVVEYPGVDDEPQGVVESVYAQVPLTRQLPQHTSDVLATGGRLAGMAWPKDRALSEDEFADAQRAWRNVTSDPNAARRLLLFPEPMEYSSGAATPEQIGIPELAALTRDEILSAFPIHPYLVGVPLAAGLNSGESLRYVRAEYWEGTMHPRVEVFEDAFQSLVSRYEQAVGRPLDFDITEPDLDDAQALQDKAAALGKLIAAGFEPKAAIAAAGLDHIEFVGVPEPPEPEPTPGPVAPGTPTPPMAPSSGVAKALKARREDTVGRELPGFRESMQQFLAEQRARIIEDVQRTLGPLTKAERKAVPDRWWDQVREDRFLRDALTGLYVRLARSALQVVADDVDRIVYRDRIRNVTETMLAKAADRITGINETTRDAVREAIAEGVRRGLSPQQIANGAAAEGFGGIVGLPAFDEARAELVARTETMLAYNTSALLGYGEFGVERVEAIDGDFDAECAARNGQSFTIDDALNVDEHPNGTLDWAPIVDKARHDDTDRVALAAIDAMKAVAAREPVAPVVNQAPITVNPPAITLEVPAKVDFDITPVADAISALTDAQRTLAEDIAAMKATPAPAPIVNLPAPIVNVEPPIVTVKAPPVTDVRVTSMPDRVHKIARDRKGTPTHSVETDL